MVTTAPTFAVLASGQGTNFEALAAAAERDRLGGRIVLLASDREDAPVLARARRLGIESVVLPCGAFRTRIENEHVWVETLRQRGVDGVLLAGFMRRLHDTFLRAFPDRILNIHPSLLPSFPGRDAIHRAWEHGVKVAGATVHVVTSEVDGGPILAQSAVEVLDSDTLETFEARVHEAEHRLYSDAVRRFVTEPWRREGARIVFGGSLLGAPGALVTARPPLDAVLFDAGGTLVRIDFEWIADTLAQLGAPVPIATLRRAEVEGRRRYDASVGRAVDPQTSGGDLSQPFGSKGDAREYFGGTLEAAGVNEPARSRALDAIHERQLATGIWSRPMEGARAAIDALGARGLRLAVVSNSDGRCERHLVDAGVRDGLELIVDSAIVGVEKPDPRIFHVALERLGIAAERALFVGDIRSVDSVGAAAAGVSFVLIDPYGDYASPGTATISGMHELAAFVAERFEVGGRPAPHAPTLNREVTS